MKLVQMKYILLFCCTMLAVSPCAQTTDVHKGDSVAAVARKQVADDDTYRAGNYGFNAAERWAMQDRYRGVDKVQYSNDNIFSHLSIGFSAAMNKIVARKDFDYNTGNNFGISITKELTKVHALSLLGEYGKYSLVSDECKLETYSLQLNHHFNFTRYYLGYNPYRPLEISSTLGVGMQNSSLKNNYDTSGFEERDDVSKYFYLGVLLNLKLDGRISLSVEPNAVLASEGYNGAAPGYWYSKYNFRYGARASLNYTLHNEIPANAYADKTLQAQNYIFLASGLQATDAPIGLGNTLGSYLNFGVGHWFAKRFALQGAVGYSTGAWHETAVQADDKLSTPEHKYYSRTQYAFTRMEAVANIYSSIKDRSDLTNEFSLNVSGGYEYGFLWKYKGNDIENQTNCWYGGPTAALQLKYHSCEGKALYLEPRISYVNYGIPYNPPYQYIKKEYSDIRYSLALGVEFGTMPKKPSADTIPVSNVRYTPEISLFAGGGTNYMFERGYYDGPSRLSTTLSLGLEYQPFSLLGARLMFDYSSYAFNSLMRYGIAANGKTNYQRGLWQKNYRIASAILDLKLDLTNLFYGYDADRRWNTAFYVGPMFSKYSSIKTEIDDSEVIPENATAVNSLIQKPTDSFLGLHTAVNTRYAVTPALGIFGELGAKVYKNEFMNEVFLDFNPIRAVSVQLGVNYRINQNQLFAADATGKILQPLSYLFFATGLQAADTSVDLYNKLGPYMSLGAGRWFTRHLALQVGAGYSSGSWHRMITPADPQAGHPEYNYYSKAQQAFARVEAVTPLFTTIKDRNDIAGKFSLNLLAGYEFGKQWKYFTNDIELQQTGSYGGPTGALQFKFHSVDGNSIFVEPRISMLNYSADAAVPFDHLQNDYTDLRYSLAVGMEYGSTPSDNGEHKDVEQLAAFTPEISVSAAGGTNYMFKRGLCAGEPALNTSFTAGVEYQPISRLGARFSLDYSNYAFNVIQGYTEKLNGKYYHYKGLCYKNYKVFSGIFDLKLDLTNLLAPYRPDKKWSSAIYLGPILSFYGGMTAELNADELLLTGSEVLINDEAPDGMFLGMHTAFNCRYNINRNWGIFGECGLKFYKNEFMTEPYLDYNPIRAMSWQVGVNYKIK